MSIRVSSCLKNPRLKIRRWLAVVAGLVLVLAVVLVAFPVQLLCVNSRLRTSDALVVLGGEPGLRASHAATLVTNGLAPRVFVSGQGDCETMRNVLARQGVRTNIIELECASTSTRENALFTVELLRAQKCRRVILVTSWYQSRRALSSFRKYAPEIEFLSAPAMNTKTLRDVRANVVAEYLKTLAYALRYGIWPVAE